MDRLLRAVFCSHWGLLKSAYPREPHHVYKFSHEYQQQPVPTEKMASPDEYRDLTAHELKNPLNFIQIVSEPNRTMLLKLKGEKGQGKSGGSKDNGR